MSRSFVTDLLITLLLADSGWAVLKNSENEPLDDGSVTKVSLTNAHGNEAFMQQISIAPTSNITFNITDIPSNVSFIIFQVHTYQYNVTLSYDKAYLNKVSNKSVFGSNIGLYVKTNLQNMTQLFLKNDNVRTVDALVVAVAYNNKAPIPGGCNMEFNTEVAPYEKLFVRDAVIIVDVQPASVPLVGKSQPFCEKNPVEHEIYHIYLPEQDFTSASYFREISSMLTVEDIVQNGRKIPSAFASSPMRRVFSAYTGIGSVYVAVATYGNYSSAYVPAFSYGCNPVLYPETCQILNDSLSKMICAVTFFLGFFSIFLGYRHLRTDMILPILFSGTVAGYAIAVGTSNYDAEINIGIAIATGFAAVLLWTLLNTFATVISSLIFSLTLGFFFASIAYFHAPVTFVILENDWVFWALFLTVILTVSLVMTILYTVTFVFTCALFGSYMMVLPIDYYAGSSLKYIMINVIRRATVADFGVAIVNPPYQAKDISLTVLWICLALYRIIKQCCPGVVTIPRLKVLPRMNAVSEATPLITARFAGRVNVTEYS